MLSRNLHRLSEQLWTSDRAGRRVLETVRLRLANAVTALATDPHQTQHTGGLGQRCYVVREPQKEIGRATLAVKFSSAPAPYLISSSLRALCHSVSGLKRGRASEIFIFIYFVGHPASFRSLLNTAASPTPFVYF